MYVISYEDVKFGVLSKEFDSFQQFINQLEETPTLPTLFDQVVTGSDPFHRIVVDGEVDVNIGRWSYNTIDKSLPVSQWVMEGRRLLSPIGSDTSSYFKYQEIEGVRTDRVVRREEQSIRFADPSGTVFEFRKILVEHREELLKFTRPSCILGYPETDDALLFIDWTSDIETTLKLYSEMSCFFVGLELYFCINPLLDFIRDKMGIVLFDDPKKNRKHIPMELPQSLAGFLPFFHVEHSSAERNNCLSMRIIQLLNRMSEDHDGDDCIEYSFTSSLNVEEIAHVCGFLGIDAYIIREYQYLKIQNVLNMCQSAGGGSRTVDAVQYKEVIDTVYGNETPSLYVTIKGSRPRTNTSKRIATCLIRMTNEFSTEGHLEFQLNYSEVLAFTTHIIRSRFFEMDYGWEHGEEGRMMNKRIPYTEHLSDISKDSFVAGIPQYASSSYHIDTNPGMEINTPYIIRTKEELIAYYEELKRYGNGEVQTSWVTEYNTVFIDPQSFTIHLDVLQFESGEQQLFSMKHLVDELLVANYPQVRIIYQSIRMDILKRVRSYHEELISIDYSIQLQKRITGDKMNDEIEEHIHDTYINHIDTNQLNVRTSNSILSFEMQVGLESVKVEVRKVHSTEVIECIVDNYLKTKITFPLLDLLKRNGEDKYNEFMKDLRVAETNAKGGDRNEQFIWNQMKERIPRYKDYKSWISLAWGRSNVVFDSMYYDKYNISTVVKSLDTSGKVLLDRIRTIDSPDVEYGKLKNPREFEVALPQVSYDAKEYSMSSLVLFDQKTQYLSIAMGNCNTVRPTDPWNMWPQFMTERNPSLQNITYPILSYFADCGTINIDPSIVDFEKLKLLTKWHSRHGSRLYNLLSSKRSSMVISSVDLISWTMDILEENQVDIRLYNSTLHMANLFQFGILKIKTGRFCFKVDIRECIQLLLKENYFSFGDFGSSFIENEDIFQLYDTHLRYRLIVPTHCQLLLLNSKYIGNELSFFKQGVSPVGLNPLLFSSMDTKGLLHKHTSQSVGLFGLFATTVLKCQFLAGYENDKMNDDEFAKELKFMFNSSIGKLRKSTMSGFYMKTLTELMNTKEYNATNAFIESKEKNLNLHVYMTSFEKSNQVLLEACSVLHSFTRMAPEGFRNYIVGQSARTIEKICLALPENSPCFEIKTDSVLVASSNEKYVEILFSEYTRHNPIPVCSLPGYTIGYRKTYYTFDEVVASNKFKHILERRYSQEIKAGMYCGIETFQQAPSVFKQQIDTIVKSRITNSLFMYQYYQEIGCPLQHLLPDNTTVENFKYFIIAYSHAGSRYPEVYEFQKEFDKIESVFLSTEDNLLITGGPGCGKTHTINNILDGMYEEEGTKYSVSPYHALANTFRAVVTHSYTLHSFMGCKLNIASIVDDPYRLLSRDTENANKYMAPYKKPNAITIFDEVQSMSKYAEEGLKAAHRVCGKIIISGDSFQMGPIFHEGIDLYGSVVQSITHSLNYVKDIEYRNRDIGYVKLKDEIRKGNSLLYLDPRITEYINGPTGLSTLQEQLELISCQLLVTGYSNITIACQNYNIAAICIITVVRLLVKTKTYDSFDFILTHIGNSSSAKEDEDKDNAEVLVRYMYTGSDPHCHQQKLFGIPLLFFEGIRYITIRTFRCQYIISEDIDRVQLPQSTVLEYIKFEYEMCSFTKKGKADQEMTTRLLHFRVVNGGPDLPEMVKVSEFEAVTYLMYPFVAQQIGLIGLTLDEIVVLRVSLKVNYHSNRPYVRSYEPIRDQLATIQHKYKNYSYLTDLCKQLQVVTTRVKTGSKTKMIDLELENISFMHLNYDAMTGIGCKGFMTFLDTEDRRLIRIKQGNMYNKIVDMKKKIMYRSMKMKQCSKNAAPVSEYPFDFPCVRCRSDNSVSSDYLTYMFGKEFGLRNKRKLE